MKHSFIQLLFATGLIAALTGCDNNSKDPLKDYKDLSNDVPPQERVIRNQKQDQCSAVIVTEPTMVVTEGQAILHDVFVRGIHSALTEDVVIGSAVEGLSIRKVGVTQDGIHFVLKYAPLVGTIEANKNYFATEVELTPASQAKSFVQCPEKVGLVVTRNNEHPVISKVTAPENIDLGTNDSATLIVDVKALGVTQKDQLRMYIDFDESANSKENPIYNISQALTLVVAAKPMGNGIFRYQYDISKELLKLILAGPMKANATTQEFETLFQITAFNRTLKLDSPAQNVVIKIAREKTADEVTK